VSPLGVNVTNLERGSKGRPPFGGARGVPAKPLFSFLLAACDGEGMKKELGETPNLGRETLAPFS